MKKKFKKATVAVAALSLAVSCIPTTTFPQNSVIVKASVDNETFEMGNLKYQITGNNTQVILLGFTENTVDRTTLTIPATVNYDGYDFPVTTIANGAFKDCIALTEIVFTDKDGNESNTTNLTTIDRNAFEGCTGLTTLTLAEGITTINGNAFLDCTNLTTVNFPATFTTVNESYDEYGPLKNCTGLQKVTFAEGATTIPNHIFSNCDFIANSHFTIPSTVTKIGDYAFHGLTKLDSFTFPEHLEVIGNNSFSECTGLTSIQLPETLTTLSSSSFSKCSGLTEVTIPKNVTKVDEDYSDVSPFAECENLKKVVFQDGITNIPDYMLCEASSVTEVVIPDSVTSIGTSAFKELTQITNITLPSNLVTINKEAFYKCSSLSSISFPETVTTLGSNSFYACNRLTEVTLPKSLAKVDTAWTDVSPFVSCENLKKVVFQDGLVKIPDYILNGASSVTEIVIPDSVTTIGTSAFEKLGQLQSIALPKNLTTINRKAFSECSSLSSISFPDTVTTLGGNSFYACNRLTEVTLPKNLAKVDTFWSGESPFTSCENLETVTFQEGTVTIPSDILNNTSSVKQVVIPSSVTGIKDSAFKNITTNITIYGYTNSYAEAYAKKYEIPFISIGVAPTTVPTPTNTTPAATAPVTTATNSSITAPTQTATNSSITAPTPTVKPTAAPVKAPKKATISSVKRNSAKKATVKWKKISGVAGYQITYAAKSNFKGAKTKNVANTKTSYTITGLKKGKIYYVKVRAYKKDSNGKKVLGTYSAVKKIKK